MNTPVAPFVGTLRRASCLLFCLVGLAFGTSARADDVLPRPAAPKRYEKLAAHSPFAPPTGPVQAAPPPPPPPPGPTWSDNLTVTSLVQNGNLYTATVVEKDSSNHFLIRSDVENADNHMELATVKWADKPDAIKVTVRKGTQFGDVRFDPSATAPSGDGGPAAQPQPFVPPPRPNFPNPAANFRPPPGVPAPAPNMPIRPGPGNIMRSRPIIRSNPPLAPVVRPLTATPLPGRALAPVKPSKDDDDDDDN